MGTHSFDSFYVFSCFFAPGESLRVFFWIGASGMFVFCMLWDSGNEKVRILRSSLIGLRGDLDNVGVLMTLGTWA